MKKRSNNKGLSHKNEAKVGGVVIKLIKGSRPKPTNMRGGGVWGGGVCGSSIPSGNRGNKFDVITGVVNRTLLESKIGGGEKLIKRKNQEAKTPTRRGRKKVFYLGMLCERCFYKKERVISGGRGSKSKGKSILDTVLRS